MPASLKLAFGAGDGKKVSLSFAPADVNATEAQVKSLMQEIVANGDIYAEPPLEIIEASFDVRSVIPVSLD